MTEEQIADEARRIARKPPQRHPSTAIPEGIVREISYRTYLLRMEPPMTPEQSYVTVREGKRPGQLVNDESRKRASKGYDPLTRTYLKVLVDLGLVTL